jgi:hypothetical protein
MELVELREVVTAVKKRLDAVDKALATIMRLEQKRAEHTPEINAHVAKAVALAEQVERDMPVLAEVAPWSATYLAEVEHTAEQARARFGATLADALQRHNMTLSGQYPLLKVGLFVLQLDFDKNRVTIWYGPRQERLAQCHARVSDVVQSITTTRDALGSSLPEHDLLARLQTAYRRANDNRPGESIPLVAVLSELAPLMQEPQWRHDPQQQHYRSYPWCARERYASLPDTETTSLSETMRTTTILYTGALPVDTLVTSVSAEPSRCHVLVPRVVLSLRVGALSPSHAPNTLSPSHAPNEQQGRPVTNDQAMAKLERTPLTLLCPW